ncbi:pantoate--beta-alanine ligase [Niabella drilacis]|uniref:Pantothenate synthetase n=1 Tax=Niabella drilacis (strain DSM 25811 / CCM 8410 / CCUG 62505 / LMG 26954 / E90) TaxID=1285928 RepID=A0A1G6WW61_NIADE|nr:pantoate--beta-alanine ligase [Niabella drilacis]SDD70138.1 pantoate--beta-alanine ligase [Niabella drilacis]
MRLYKKRNDIQGFITHLQDKKQEIGFVPTMGALHAGHISLIRTARQQSDFTVCSIFVNPTQFNDPKDLQKYPRTIEKDLYLLEQHGCDAVFYPEVAEVYPPGSGPAPHYDLGRLESILEGAYRPGHFQGVADVVSRLFYTIHPDKVFFGQKDLQQCRVIERLIAGNPDFDKIRMNIVPTLREPDGLAMSSRNTRLSPEELRKAPEIYQTLLYLKEQLAPGDLAPLQETAKTRLTREGFRPDYVSIVDTQTLETCGSWNGHTPLTGLVAAYLGEVRLIDNLELV